MTRNPKAIVRDGYNRIAAHYCDWVQNSQVREQIHSRFLPLVPKGGNILDLGCGAGIPSTKALAAHGRVTGVDISSTQIALAKANVPDAEFICADMSVAKFSSEHFDAIAAFYALTHLPRSEHAAMLTQIFDWLKPGGVFLATLGAVDLPDYVDENWLGAPNFFSHFDAAENLRLVRAAGFVIHEQDIVRQDLEGETHVSFLWVIAHKPQE